MILAYGSLSGCHANRQIVFAVILENLCSQACKKRKDCEGSGLWKDAVSGFYCVNIYIYIYIYIYTVEPRSIVPATIIFPHVPFAIFGPE